MSRRLIVPRRGAGTFVSPAPPPALVASGPYSASRTVADTILTQVHCHTNQSDGSYSPGAVVADYAGAGYGALILTDHDKVTSQPAGVGIGISGTELSPTTGHVIAMDTTYTRGSETSIQALIDGVASDGGLTQLAHPKWIRGHSYASMAALTDWSGMEIHNAKCVSGAGQNPVSYPGYALDRWDQVLAGLRRDAWGFAVDDLHGIDAVNTYDVGRLQVFAETGDAAGVMAAIASGNFVADVSNHGVTPGYPDLADDGVSLSCTGATRIEAWGSAGLLASATGSSLSYEFTGLDAYVRLVAVGQYAETFASALSDRWGTVAGTWTATGGELELASTASIARIILRRHRAGDFTATWDVTPHSTSDYVGLMFNVLNTSYYYLLRLGPSTTSSYNNKLALGKTTNNSFGTPLATTPYTIEVDTTYRVALDYTSASGTMRAKVWRPGTDAEPDWMVTASDTSWTHGAFGFRATGSPTFENLTIDGFRTYYQPIALDAA